MKINKLSIIAGIIGAGVIVFAFIRWAIGYKAYYDPSQFALFASIGVIIIGSAYLYNWMKNTDEAITKLDDQQIAIMSWQRKDKLKEEFE